MAAGRRVTWKLRQFWKAIDNSEVHFVPHLHLNHFGGQAGPDPLSIFDLELDLASTAFNQVVQQQRSEVLQIFVAGMLAEIENFRHCAGLTNQIGQASLSPNASH